MHNQRSTHIYAQLLGTSLRSDKHVPRVAGSRVGAAEEASEDAAGFRSGWCNWAAPEQLDPAPAQRARRRPAQPDEDVSSRSAASASARSSSSSSNSSSSSSGSGSSSGTTSSSSNSKSSPSQGGASKSSASSSRAGGSGRPGSRDGSHPPGGEDQPAQLEVQEHEFTRGSKTSKSKVPFGCCWLIPRCSPDDGSVIASWQMSCNRSGHNDGIECTKEYGVRRASSESLCLRRLKCWIVMAHKAADKAAHHKLFNHIEKLKDSPGPDGLPCEEELDGLAQESQASMSVPVSIPSQVGGATSSSSAGRRSCRKGHAS